jgi:stage II sporulation protein D
MSPGQRVANVRIGGQLFTGREVREKLDLPSSSFTTQITNGMIEFTTYGYGHGVGMSQWGANGMAKEGRTAEEIVKYYYQGVEIKRIP